MEEKTNRAEPGEPESGSGGSRDPIEELGRRIDAAIQDAGPRIRGAMEQLEQRVDAALNDIRPRMDAAVDDVRPRVEAAVRDVQPRVDRFVRDVQPRMDSLLARLQKTLDDLRRDMEMRARRAASPVERQIPPAATGSAGSADGDVDDFAAREGRPGAGGTADGNG